MQVLAKFRDQRAEARLGRQRDFLEIDGRALVTIAGQKPQKLRAEIAPPLLIAQKLSDVVQPLSAHRIEVVDQRHHVHSGFFRLEKRHDLIVHGPHRRAVGRHSKKLVGGVHALNISIGAQNVQPFREQNVDLRIILLQRYKAGGIPGHIESRADALIGIQNDVRRRRLRLAMGRFDQRSRTARVFLQRTKFAALFLEDNLRQLFGTQRNRDDKKDDQRGHGNAQHVEQQAQAHPSLLFGIVKYRLWHGGNS